MGLTISLICALILVEANVQSGTVWFELRASQDKVPDRYRLTAHEFSFELTAHRELAASGIEIYNLRFPSPVTTPHPENNTVHAQYFRPKGAGPFPGVIVLDITGGDQSLSRSISMMLAQNKIAALFVQMPYYGPRRPPGTRLRLMSTNIHHTLGSVRQTVLDLRRASAWLESRPEIDPKRLGIMGTSLGSFMAALTAEMEPRLNRVVVLLGGGGLVDAYYDHPQAAPYRKVFEALGGKKEDVIKMIAPADPLTCAENLKERKLLIIAGSRDDIVPPKAAEALWNASGRQQIIWYDCTHYSAIMYFLPAMQHIVKHFGAE